MIFFLVFFFFAFAQEGRVDGMVAVVGNRAVFHSEIIEQTLMLAKQKEIGPQKTHRLELLYDSVLNETINRLVVLESASKDTSISVDRDEINKSLDLRIDYFVDVFGSKEALEDTMKKSIKELKFEFWDTVAEELLVEKFRYKTFNNIAIGREEVISFFTENPDSFPKPPVLGEFSILQVPVLLSKESRSALFSLADSLVSILRGGGSFEVLAKQFSEHGPSAEVGGDLGFISRGSFIKEFERVAFSLDEGKISSPFETELGLHIIKINQRLGERVRVQQILLSLLPNKEDLGREQVQLQSIKEELFNDPAAFDSLATSFYKKHLNSSGYFVDYDIGRLPLHLFNRVSSLEDFSFSAPFEFGGDVFLIYRYKIFKEAALSLEKDWSQIEGWALDYKRFRLFNLWIKKEKEKIYVKVFSL